MRTEINVYSNLQRNTSRALQYFHFNITLGTRILNSFTPSAAGDGINILSKAINSE